MKDKELLIEAVENSSQFSPKQRAILKLFLDIEVNEIASSTPKELAEILQTSRQTVYEGLKTLEGLGLIRNLSENGKPYNIYKLDIGSFDNLMQAYLNKKKYLKKS